MKLSKMLIAALAVFTLASCSKDANEGLVPDTKGEKTFATITLSQAAVTKAASEAPTTQEGAVKSATLYIFNSTQQLEKIVTFDADTKTKVIEVTTGVHYFYAAVNIPAGNLTGIAENSTTIAAFEKKLMGTFSNINDLTSATTGFWMTNVSKAPAVTLVVATETEATNGDKNDITISVGRAVAKVNVEFAPLSQPAGKLSSVEYKSAGIANAMYLMPNYEGGILKTPYYAESWEAGKYFMSDKGYQAANGTPANADYVMENSHAQPQQGSATYVVISGVFTPDQSCWRNGADGTLVGTPATTGSDFWRIANHEGDPATTNIIGWEPDYYSSDPTSRMTDAAKQSVVKYTAGKTYYAIWLAKSDIPTSDPARFTVKRNSYYYVTINSVVGAGSNAEEGVITEPTDPIVTTPTWIKATIQVLDWTVINQNVGI